MKKNSVGREVFQRLGATNEEGATVGIGAYERVLQEMFTLGGEGRGLCTAEGANDPNKRHLQNNFKFVGKGHG